MKKNNINQTVTVFTPLFYNKAGSIYSGKVLTEAVRRINRPEAMNGYNALAKSNIEFRRQAKCCPSVLSSRRFYCAHKFDIRNSDNSLNFLQLLFY